MEKELPFKRPGIAMLGTALYNHKHLIIVYRIRNGNKKRGNAMGKIPEYVGSVLWALERAGHEAWCVGGCVRDLHLGRTPEDWDVTSSATPEEVMAVFGGCALPTGIKHGTVTVQAGRGRVEVTTFRKDGVYLDHRRPETVTFTSSRKKICGAGISPSTPWPWIAGRLAGPVWRYAGSEERRLRCVGDPDSRFQEDALRLLRGMRFAAGMGLFVEEATEASIHRNRELLREIAAERFGASLPSCCGACRRRGCCGNIRM